MGRYNVDSVSQSLKKVKKKCNCKERTSLSLSHLAISHYSIFLSIFLFFLFLHPSNAELRLRASAHECCQEEEAKWDEVGDGSSKNFFFFMRNTQDPSLWFSIFMAYNNLALIFSADALDENVIHECCEIDLMRGWNRLYSLTYLTMLYPFDFHALLAKSGQKWQVQCRNTRIAKDLLKRDRYIYFFI